MKVSPMSSGGIAATQTALVCAGAAPAAEVRGVRAMENPLTIAPPVPQPGRPGDYTQPESKVTLLCNKSRKRLIL